MDFFLKEITVKCAFAYDDRDFRETVDAFVKGRSKQRWWIGTS